MNERKEKKERKKDKQNERKKNKERKETKDKFKHHAHSHAPMHITTCLHTIMKSVRIEM